MKNKPVAWIDDETGCFVYSQYDYEDLDEYGKDGLIPLYTHPSAQQWTIDVKVKDLTDEEIKEVWTGTKWSGFEPIELTFARAILRKAQEK